MFWSLEDAVSHVEKKRSRSSIYRDRIKNNGYLGINYNGSQLWIFPISSVTHCQIKSFENQGLSQKNVPSSATQAHRFKARLKKNTWTMKKNLVV